MRYAAFFRNLNLGRSHSPTRDQLEAAFLQSGALAAQSFLTNGTIAFDAGSARAAKKVLADACKVMAAQCGLKEPGFLREMDYLARLVQTDPFHAVNVDRVYGCYITFLHGAASGLATASPRGDVEVVQLADAEVLCIAHQLGKSPGSPNAFIEKALALPATTRAWNTVVRLVQKHGQ
jgi:uncharacterized protein (DUF1697 family)